MFFYKKRKHKKHKNGGKVYDTSGCIKQKVGKSKRFGLSQMEMSDLVYTLISKPKVPIVFVR